jgi:PAS domain-containing protein
VALSVLPLDLARWDETARDCLVLPVFKDDRPLRGAAGLADWRLCGKLSRLLKASRASADAGETLLLPPGRRLRFGRILWFGLGDAKSYSDERFRKMFAESPCGAAIVGADGRWLQVNPELASLVGVPEECMLGRLGPRFVHPGDVPLLDRA